MCLLSLGLFFIIAHGTLGLWINVTIFKKNYQLNDKMKLKIWKIDRIIGNTKYKKNIITILTYCHISSGKYFKYKMYLL